MLPGLNLIPGRERLRGTEGQDPGWKAISDSASSLKACFTLPSTAGMSTITLTTAGCFPPETVPRDRSGSCGPPAPPLLHPPSAQSPGMEWRHERSRIPLSPRLCLQCCLLCPGQCWGMVGVSSLSLQPTALLPGPAAAGPQGGAGLLHGEPCLLPPADHLPSSQPPPTRVSFTLNSSLLPSWVSRIPALEAELRQGCCRVSIWETSHLISHEAQLQAACC